MLEIIKKENFDLLNSSGISYGGHGGSKRGIIINDERINKIVEQIKSRIEFVNKLKQTREFDNGCEKQ